jgi:hypothetical protein
MILDLVGQDTAAKIAEKFRPDANITSHTRLQGIPGMAISFRIKARNPFLPENMTMPEESIEYMLDPATVGASAWAALSARKLQLPGAMTMVDAGQMPIEQQLGAAASTTDAQPSRWQKGKFLVRSLEPKETSGRLPEPAIKLEPGSNADMAVESGVSMPLDGAVHDLDLGQLVGPWYFEDEEAPVARQKHEGTAAGEAIEDVEMVDVGETAAPGEDQSAEVPDASEVDKVVGEQLAVNEDTVAGKPAADADVPAINAAEDPLAAPQPQVVEAAGEGAAAMLPPLDETTLASLIDLLPSDIDFADSAAVQAALLQLLAGMAEPQSSPDDDGIPFVPQLIEVPIPEAAAIAAEPIAADEDITRAILDLQALLEAPAPPEEGESPTLDPPAPMDLAQREAVTLNSPAPKDVALAQEPASPVQVSADQVAGALDVPEAPKRRGRPARSETVNELPTAPEPESVPDLALETPTGAEVPEEPVGIQENIAPVVESLPEPPIVPEPEPEVEPEAEQQPASSVAEEQMQPEEPVPSEPERVVEPPAPVAESEPEQRQPSPAEPVVPRQGTPKLVAPPPARKPTPEMARLLADLSSEGPAVSDRAGPVPVYKPSRPPVPFGVRVPTPPLDDKKRRRTNIEIDTEEANIKRRRVEGSPGEEAIVVSVASSLGSTSGTGTPPSGSGMPILDLMTELKRKRAQHPKSRLSTTDLGMDESDDISEDWPDESSSLPDIAGKKRRNRASKVPGEEAEGMGSTQLKRSRSESLETPAEKKARASSSAQARTSDAGVTVKLPSRAAKKPSVDPTAWMLQLPYGQRIAVFNSDPASRGWWLARAMFYQTVIAPETATDSGRRGVTSDDGHESLSDDEGANRPHRVLPVPKRIVRLKIHYEGYVDKYDEWIVLDDAGKERIKAFKKTKPTDKELAELKVGAKGREDEDVWTDVERAQRKYGGFALLSSITLDHC